MMNSLESNTNVDQQHEMVYVIATEADNVDVKILPVVEEVETFPLFGFPESEIETSALNNPLKLEVTESTLLSSNVNVPAPSTPEVSKCHLCGIKFINDDLLTRHIQRHDTNSQRKQTLETQQNVGITLVQLSFPIISSNVPKEKEQKKPKLPKGPPIPPENIRQCPICGVRYISEDLMNKHLLKHVHGPPQPQPWSCPREKRRLGFQKDKMIAALKMRKLEVESQNGSFGESEVECFLEHEESKDPLADIETISKCNECGVKFENETLLKEHLKDHAENKNEEKINSKETASFVVKPVPEVCFQCKICGIRFIAENILKKHNMLRHEESKSPPKPVVPTGRDKMWSKSESRKGSSRGYSIVEAHINGVKKKIFECNACGKRYLIPGTLFRHLRLHSENGDRILTISEEDKAKKVDSFQNDIEDKKEKEVNNLGNIQEVFQCQSPKKLRSLAHLKAHQSVPRFQCAICEETFDFAINLYKHVEEVHS